MTKAYWSERHGRGPKGGSYSLITALELFSVVVADLVSRDYFQEWFGFYCVDAGDVPGRAGANSDAHVFLALHRHDIWPPSRYAIIDAGTDDDGAPRPPITWDEDTFFDVVEFLHDRVSYPEHGRFHGFSGCGWHYDEFDAAEGQLEYRTAINPILAKYSGGFELSDTGELRRAAPEGLDELYEVTADTLTDDEALRDRYSGAISKYRNRHSSPSDRRGAVRDLADVLERIRPQVREHLTRGNESALFNIANNYGIRHLDQGQALDWDDDVWLEWIFVTYLAATQLVLRLVGRDVAEKIKYESSAPF